MCIDNPYQLPLLDVSGSPFEIGVQLGRHGAKLVRRHLVRTHAWAHVMQYRDDPRVIVAKAEVEARFPRIWQELAGLSEGLELPLDEVFAWNCRGDVWAMAPDGCTTVQYPGDVLVVAHNEDGDPGLRDGCAIARIRPTAGIGFTAYKEEARRRSRLRAA
jgi:predicted choloylglycine hydrolase